MFWSWIKFLLIKVPYFQGLCICSLYLITRTRRLAEVFQLKNDWSKVVYPFKYYKYSQTYKSLRIILQPLLLVIKSLGNTIPNDGIMKTPLKLLSRLACRLREWISSKYTLNMKKYDTHTQWIMVNIIITHISIRGDFHWYSTLRS